MKLLVADATLTGTLLTRFIVGTLMTPPPTPINPETIPAKYPMKTVSGVLVTSYLTTRFKLWSSYWLPSARIRDVLSGLTSAGKSIPLALIITMVAYSRTSPKSTKSTEAGRNTATKAPVMAPATVPISRNIPSRRFVRWSRTYVAADALEVATTDTMLAPTARGTGTPSTRVRKGIIRTPPPKPKRAPTNPAMIETRRMTRTSTGPSIIPRGTVKMVL